MASGSPLSVSSQGFSTCRFCDQGLVAKVNAERGRAAHVHSLSEEHAVPFFPGLLSLLCYEKQNSSGRLPNLPTILLSLPLRTPFQGGDKATTGPCL